MNTKSILGFFVSLSVLFSCTDRDYNVIKSFPEECNASLVKEVTYDPTEYFIGNITWTNGYWIYELQEEPFFVLLDKDYNEITRFGREGNGPGEFLFPILSKTTAHTNTVDIHFLDRETGRLYNASINKNDGNLHLSELKDFGKNLREAHPLDDGCYICNGFNNRYYFLEKDGEERYLEGWGEEVNEAAELSYTYTPKLQTLSAISPDNNLLAIYGITQQALILHNIDGTHIKTVYIGEEPNPQIYFSQTGTFGGVVFIGNTIVALYNSVKDECSYLMVFDRELSPLKRYRLPINGNILTGNPEEGVVTVLSYDDEKMYCYDLSEWL